MSPELIAIIGTGVALAGLSSASPRSKGCSKVSGWPPAQPPCPG